MQNMFRISTVAFALLFLTMLFVRGDCRPQSRPTISLGGTLDGVTDTLTDVVEALPPVIDALPPVLSAVGGVLNPVGNLPSTLPLLGGTLLT